MSGTGIALIALPWHPFDYFSLQLGTLTAYLRRAGHTVDALHYYRDFGSYLPYRVFSALHKGSHGEALFAALLYPERKQIIEDELTPSLPPGTSFQEVLEAAEKYLDDCASHKDWTKYYAVGFTLSHEQLMASMGLARRIKALSPQTRIIVGGALVVPPHSTGLLRVFPEIDLAICGEGERTLLEVVKKFEAEKDDWESIPGLVYRNGIKIEKTSPSSVITDLDQLPYPDYSDFFENEVAEGSSRVVPRISFEISRGCSWGKCRFCNLSHQWGGHVRRKSTERVRKELLHQVTQYRSSRILVCDTNISAWSDAFAAIAELDLDLEIFAEVSVHLNREDLEIMRKAGVRSIQVGIEAFSDHLLQCYRKGASVMRNLEMLKWAEEFGIQIGYNLIIRYPGERKEDVEESLEVIRYARHFSPPNLVNYSLSYKSDAFQNPEEHNVKSYSIPGYYHKVYPPEVIKEIGMFLTLWVVPEPLRDPGTEWMPVENAVDRWRDTWQRNPGAKRLTWRDCKEFMIIDSQPEPGEIARSWRLSDIHRKLYLACNQRAQSIDDLVRLNIASENTIRSVLRDLHEMGILFFHQDHALSLAIRDA